MLAAFIITLREGLEAALIVGIVLAVLARMKKQEQFRQVYLGVTAAIIISVIFAIGFYWVTGGLTGEIGKIFEGITTLIAAILLTTMIIWMSKKGPKIKSDLEEKAEAALSTPSFGVFFLIFFAVLREGVETVLFLFAIPVKETSHWLGASLGFIIAVGVAIIYFIGAKQINVQTFFRITTILLVIFAAGMVAYGVHELQEAAVLPTYIEHVWDMNFILDENSPVGQILKGLIGYNGNPSLLEIVSYSSYLIGIGTYYYYRMKIQHSMNGN
ncbi:MAG: FTR1 family iron permease [Candidatus Helarchaeota archaeon]